MACLVAPLRAIAQDDEAPEGSELQRPAEGEISVDLCLDTHTHSQELRQQGRLLESRKELLVCSAQSCPAAIRRDCANWVEQIRAQIPTVSFRATMDGETRSNVEVYLDGELVTNRLSGRAIEINPGVYSVRFVARDADDIERELVINEGEQFRVVHAEFVRRAAPPGATGPGVPGAPADPPAVRVETSAVPVSAWVFAGLGAAAAASGATWGLLSWTEKNNLEKSCAPGCTDGQIGVVRRRALIADISWGLSVASFATAATLYFLEPSNSTESPELDVSLMPGGGAYGTLTFSTP